MILPIYYNRDIYGLYIGGFIMNRRTLFLLLIFTFSLLVAQASTDRIWFSSMTRDQKDQTIRYLQDSNKDLSDRVNLLERQIKELNEQVSNLQK
jgi:hypothetical protein